MSYIVQSKVALTGVKKEVQSRDGEDWQPRARSGIDTVQFHLFLTDINNE